MAKSGFIASLDMVAWSSLPARIASRMAAPFFISASRQNAEEL